MRKQGIKVSVQRIREMSDFHFVIVGYNRGRPVVRKVPRNKEAN